MRHGHSHARADPHLHPRLTVGRHRLFDIQNPALFRRAAEEMLGTLEHKVPAQVGHTYYVHSRYARPIPSNFRAVPIDTSSGDASGTAASAGMTNRIRCAAQRPLWVTTGHSPSKQNTSSRLVHQLEPRA